MVFPSDTALVIDDTGLALLRPTSDTEGLTERAPSRSRPTLFFPGDSADNSLPGTAGRPCSGPYWYNTDESAVKRDVGGRW